MPALNGVPLSLWQMGTTVFDHRAAHACNCIGCCRECGGCLTDPMHATLHPIRLRHQQEIAEAVTRPLPGQPPRG